MSIAWRISALWFRQLWAESLGKDGKGTTPIRAMGTVDQHSQLQLYLAGPADKMFTLVTSDIAGKARSSRPISPAIRRSPISPASAWAICWMPSSARPSKASSATAARLGASTSTRLDEKTLGGLLMHFMLETIIAADLFGVNAFDQPAVEEGKVIARQYLGEMGRQAAQ